MTDHRKTPTPRDGDAPEAESFLERWSRLKRAGAGAARTDAASDGDPGVDAQEASRPGRMITDPKALGLVPDSASRQDDGADDAPAPDAGAPDDGAESAGDPASLEDVDFDQLDYASDYTRFMAPGVPDAIRRRALSVLWQSDPILANLDGLNDYDEDFTDAALAVKTLKTAHKVGKGYLADEDEDGEEDGGEGDEVTAAAEETRAATGRSAQDAGEPPSPGAESDPETEPPPREDGESGATS